MKTPAEIAKETGMTQHTIRARIRKGYPEHLIRYVGNIPKSAISEKYNERIEYEIDYNGARMTLYEVASKIGIPYTTLKMRYIRGERGEDLLKEPVHHGIHIKYGRTEW